ncbi:MAG TPA: NAD-dependent epimerase/dehydratase family protein [Crocinitomicaceae bacterium]|nr:NAD-dependent epimerase/dehydratase family protein [Crocinitomicaceae bacterium]
MKKILVIGAGGQIGSELVLALRKTYGVEAVVAADLKDECPQALSGGTYIQMNILDKEAVRKYIIENTFSDVYLLAALLSATAEKNPELAWKLNMDGLLTILDLAKEGHIEKIFWPSSIAVFGPNTPRVNTPQYTIMNPSTVYGISKQAGERWCEYYNMKFGVDVRSIRYPGLISHTSLPGGGTTDYAVDIFYHAKAYGKYTSFLSENTALPMMYMDDAIRATLQLMDAPKENITIRSAYNLGGISFTPKQLADAIAKKIPFTISYAPDFRQEIANSWPGSIDDTYAQTDWNWKLEYDLDKMVAVMLENVNPEKLFGKSSIKSE